MTAGRFLGSSAALGIMALDAAANSKSVKDFNKQGNWGTVGATAVGGAIGGTIASAPALKTASADRKLDRIIKNPKSVQKYTPAKFQRLANSSSWTTGISSNGKGFRAYNGNGQSIRYNGNGTRFDAAHFYGKPYWVVSSPSFGKEKFPMR